MMASETDQFVYVLRLHLEQYFCDHAAGVERIRICPPHLAPINPFIYPANVRKSAYW